MAISSPISTIILYVLRGSRRCSAPPRGAHQCASDRFEVEDVKFHQQLRDAYRQIAANEPQRCVLIDANVDAAAVAAAIWATVRDRLFAVDAGSAVNVA